MKSFRSMFVENTLEVIKDVTTDVSKIFNELRSVISSRMVTILKTSLLSNERY